MQRPKKMSSIRSIICALICGRSCRICGSYAVTCGILCRPCWNHLVFHWSEAIPVQALPKVTVYPTFQWVPGKSKALSEFILAHKGSGHQQAWAWIAQERPFFLKESITAYPSDSRPLILVPVPGHGGRLHALEFSLALGLDLKIEVWDCLRTQDKDTQKRRSRRQRQARQVQLSEDFSAHKLKNSRIILVDDVVTTGATAEACRRALGLTEIEVWCLAFRRRLATHS